MFNQVFFIFLLVFSLKRWGSLTCRGRWCVIVLSALSLGAMPLINTWDILLYAPFMVAIGVLVWHLTIRKRGIPIPGGQGVFGGLSSRLRSGMNCIGDAVKECFRILRKSPALIADTPWGYLIIVPPLSVLLWVPFYFQLNTQGVQGIGFVVSPTGLPEFLLVHGIFLLIFIAYLWRDIIKRPWLLLLVTSVCISRIPLGGGSACPAYLPRCPLETRTCRNSCNRRAHHYYFL